MAKMAFALPAARSVLQNPTQAELHALAKTMPNARETSYGAVNVQTRVLSRSKGSTFIVADDPEAYPHQAIDRDEWERMSARQDAYIAEAAMIQVDGFIGNDPEHRVPTRLFVEAAFANIAGHAGRPLLPRPGGGVRARAGGRLHAGARRGGLPRRSTDRRQPRPARHPRLQLGLFRRVEEGRAANVERARARARRPGAPCRLQGHPDRPGRQGRADRRALRHGQDHDHLHAPERLPPRPGRLRGVVARRLRLGDRGRLLRKDVRAQPQGRAHDPRRGHPPGGVSREREPVRRRRGRLLRPGLHQERPRGLRVRRHRGGRPRRRSTGPTSCSS